MAKLNYLHICELAFTTANSGNLNVIGIFENISSRNFPALHPRFSVVTEVSVDDGLHTISLIIKKGDKEINKIEATFPGQKNRWVNNFIGFQFPEAGEYVFEIHVDKEFLGSSLIKLVKI